MADLKTVSERIKYYRDSIGVTPKEFERKCGLTNKYLDNVRTPGIKILEKILENSPDLNREWVLSGSGEMLISKSNDADFYDTPDDIIKAPLIGQYANGGYLRGYADPEYLEEQPVFYSTRKHTGGNYVAFEVKGDSMDDGTRRAICEGDILLGRELQMHYWKSRFHIPKVFIVVHRTEGITVKEIIEHEVETGLIKCHSWNKDPEYQDFDLCLSDIVQLFYIKEISRNFKN